MAASNVKFKISRAPSLKVKVSTAITAIIRGTNGLQANKANGVVTIEPDYGALASHTLDLAELETFWLPAWDEVNDVHYRVSPEGFVTSILTGHSVTAGSGLTGGGSLNSDPTINVGAGTGITVGTDSVGLDTTHVRNVDHTAVALTAGAGLTGGGDISASRSFAVGAGTGVTVNADDVAIDYTHANVWTGGNTFALTSSGVATAAVVRSGGNTNSDAASLDFARLNGTVDLRAFGNSNGLRIKASSDLHLHAGGVTFDASNRVLSLLSTGVTQFANLASGFLKVDGGGNVSADAAVAASGTTLTAGAGLTGGGDLSANRTFNVGAGIGITVNADDVQLDTSSSRNSDHAGITLTAGAGLTGGGTITSSFSFHVGAGIGITVNADDIQLDISNSRNVDHVGVSVLAGAGLTGGGQIDSTHTLAVGAGSGILVSADAVGIASDIRNHGAVAGTNTAPVRAANTAAIIAAWAATGNAFISGGTFYIDATAGTSATRAITGDGSGVLSGDPGNGAYLLTLASYAGPLLLSDFAIEAPYGSTRTSDAIHVNGTTFARIERVRARGHRPFTFSGAGEVFADKIVADGWSERAIFADSCTSFTLVNSHVAPVTIDAGINSHGIQTYFCTKVVFSNVRVETPGNFCLSVYGDHDEVAIANCIFKCRTLEAIQFDTSPGTVGIKRFALTGNVIECPSGHSDFGISIWASNGPIRNGVIDGNLIQNSGGAGIAILDDTKHVAVTNNRIVNPASGNLGGTNPIVKYGIGIQNYSAHATKAPQYITVDGNTITDDNGYMTYPIAEDTGGGAAAPNHNIFGLNYGQLGTAGVFYQITGADTKVFASLEASYTRIHRSGSDQPAILIGNANVDLSSIYYATTHKWRAHGGATDWATLSSAGFALFGSTSGSTIIKSAAAASGTLTLPAATDTLVGKATTDTLTNKTLTSPVINGTETGSAVRSVAMGGNGVAAQPAFSVHKNGTNQTAVPTATPTVVTWSTERFDTNSNFASNKFTPQVAGKYLVTFAYEIAGTGAGTWAMIYKNGSILHQANMNANVTNAAPNIAAVVDMNGSTDYIELVAYHEHGANRDILGTTQCTWATGAWIAP